jgi:membrane protease YdiL (CAAX protease family)
MLRTNTNHYHRFTLKQGVLLCFFVIGARFAMDFAFHLLKVPSLIPDSIGFLLIVVFLVKRIGKEELLRILNWRDVSLASFASLLVMFFGFEILQSELSNLQQFIIPVPDGFFDDMFPDSVFLQILTVALFPAFTEEVFFRGILLRHFCGVYSERKAIILSALLFGLMHLNPWQAMHAFISGIFLGWIYRRYRTIWLCMLLHAYNNILASFIIYPVTILPNPTSYTVLIHHPLWFVLLGAFLFALGLVSLIVTDNSANNTSRLPCKPIKHRPEEPLPRLPAVRRSL